VQPEEIDRLAATLGATMAGTRTLAGGFSHETCLVTLADGQVVVRLGGPDPAIEAAVMAAGREQVPVPQVLAVLPAEGDGGRPVMVLEYVAGTPLSEVLDRGEHDPAAVWELGAEVGRVIARIGAATFDRPGFFADARLTVASQPPWSRQLAPFAEQCMAAAPPQRLDRATRRAWASLCAACAPALVAVDDQSRLAHADVNPKNILVTRAGRGWRVDAVLDWEFSFSGCPYGDAANMVRFGADYPDGFAAGFCAGFAEGQPAGYTLTDDWLYLGRVLDMFALSDLVTRPPGHPVADQAAEQIRRWIADGIPRSC
jgi:Ser/Thr protein kinase RdoA (MazF antagonist)